MSESIKRLRYVGLRARYAGEDCPLCDEPGSGMWLDKDESEWICTRCKTARRLRYWLTTGTVQPMLMCHDPWVCIHFGRAEYDRNKPILSDSIKQQAEPIVDALNAETMTIHEAREKLKRIWF